MCNKDVIYNGKVNDFFIVNLIEMIEYFVFAVIFLCSQILYLSTTIPLSLLYTNNIYI